MRSKYDDFLAESIEEETITESELVSPWAKQDTSIEIVEEEEVEEETVEENANTLDLKKLAGI